MRRWGIALLVLVVLLLAASGAQAAGWPPHWPAPGRVCCHGLLGDINGDKWVNALDYSILHAAYGSAEGNSRYNVRADLTCDGRVDDSDLDVLILQYWKRAK